MRPSPRVRLRERRSTALIYPSDRRRGYVSGRSRRPAPFTGRARVTASPRLFLASYHDASIALGTSVRWGPVGSWHKSRSKSRCRIIGSPRPAGREWRRHPLNQPRDEMTSQAASAACEVAGHPLPGATLSRFCRSRVTGGEATRRRKVHDQVFRLDVVLGAADNSRRQPRQQLVLTRLADEHAVDRQ